MSAHKQGSAIICGVISLKATLAILGTITHSTDFECREEDETEKEREGEREGEYFTLD